MKAEVYIHLVAGGAHTIDTHQHAVHIQKHDSENFL